jgi:XisH protein
MPAIDQCHNQIVHALEKAKWIVSPHAYTIAIQKGHVLHIDIEAHRASSLNGHIIIVEAKCFAERNAETNEMYTAIGQYLVYRSLLKPKGLADNLYLGVPRSAYQGVFSRMGMAAVKENAIKMMVVDLEKEEIVEWLV